MDNQIEITLIAQRSYYDDIGQEVTVETSNTIYGYKRSVSQSEWYSAGANDMNAELVITVYGFEYNDETIAVIDGVRYSIYRTYPITNSDFIDLYLEKKGGVTYGE